MNKLEVLDILQEVLDSTGVYHNDTAEDFHVKLNDTVGRLHSKELAEVRASRLKELKEVKTGDLKIYMISQNVNKDYDTYDSAVVAAADMEEARKMHPGGYDGQWWDLSEDEKIFNSRTWADTLEQVIVEYIGDAGQRVNKGVILASFNAG